MKFIDELKRRNKLLYWSGLFNIAVGIICLLLMQVDDKQLLNANRWIKPMKFYFSVGLMILTTGWLLFYLDDIKKVKRFTWLLIISMFFENGLIILQAISGTTSHFNATNKIDSLIFSFLGFFIIVFTITFVRINIAFFRQKKFSIPDAYLWGKRLGILVFILFSLEAGAMLYLMKHTVGGPDGSPGLPITNWSKNYGDLRIAHFAAFMLCKFYRYLVAMCQKKTAHYFILRLFLIVVAVFIQAMMGIPFMF